MGRGNERLGDLELFVLLAAMRLGEDAYAVSIAREIEEQTGRRVGRATVYVALQSLERKGLVQSALGEPRPERGGKARRIVSVTGSGRATLRSTQEALRSLWRGLDADLEAAR